MKNKEREIEFNVDAYTAKLIGRENVSKLEGAVLEIVKNAYDADATVFCLYYSNKDNCLYFMDNGCGMNEHIIRTHWMTIGNSSKKEEFVTKHNRIQTGAKGIGRFALDRLSDECQMLTISEDGGLEWIVNWNDFNGRKNLSDVKAKIYDTDESLFEYIAINSWENNSVAKIVKELNFSNKGTAFILKGLHDEWNQKTISKIRNHLENLLPPDVVTDFRIFFFDDTTPSEECEIKSSNVDAYDYKITFKVLTDTIQIKLLRNEFDFRGEEEMVYKEARFDAEQQRYFDGQERIIELTFPEIGEEKNWVGNFSGVLYFNKISVMPKDVARFYYKDITGRKNLTKHFGGIKLYRDHFRVRPYGEYGDNDFDWLELSARRNRSPAGLGHPTGKWCVGAEQLLGIIDISRENTNLEDAANRNGIQESRGFTQLKNIILSTISEFERDRQFIGRKLAAYDKDKDELEKERERIEELAEARKKWEEEQESKRQLLQGEEWEKIGEDNTKNIEDNNKENAEESPAVNPKEVSNLLKSMDARKEQELQELRDENKMLQTLATTGIITNMFMHEIRTLTNNIGQELDAAYDAIKYDNDMKSAFENILQAITFKKNFSSWFGVTIESIKKDKRKRKKQDIASMLKDFISTWTKILERNQVELVYECDENIEFRCFEFDIENIISNLISNSLASFDRENESVLEKRKINILIEKEEEGFIISYEDSGWGLVDRYKRRPELILEPFESIRGASTEDDEEGTGMGMWIINKTAIEYNGKVDLSENRKIKKGFKIKISLGGIYV